MNKFSSPPAPKTVDDFVAGAPVSTVPPVTATAPPPVTTMHPKEEHEQVYKSVTARLTKERYKRLKMLSTVNEEPIQQLLMRAIDTLLDKEAP